MSKPILNSQKRLSKAEKNKNYTDKLKKDGKYDDYKKKKAAVMKERRQKEKESENAISIEKRSDTINKIREANRKYMQKYRERLRTKSTPEKTTNVTSNVSHNLRDITSKSYHNIQTLGKAVKKATRGFPSSQRKKKAVLAQIFNDLDDNDRSELVIAILPPRHRTVLANKEELLNDIRIFYNRDDITRTSPKTNDTKEYKLPDGSKELMPKQYMTLTVKEPHALFINERREESKGELKVCKF